MSDADVQHMTMFYHQGILQKRGGKFGIIWIAATKIDQLKRRDFSSVNVRKTCDDIMEHIMAQMSGKRGKSRTRLSLYLSSQLMYGVVRVFSKQNDYLLVDASSFFTRVKLATSMAADADIDLRAIYKYDHVTNPDFDAFASPSRPGYIFDFGAMKQAREIEESYPDVDMIRVNTSMEQFRQRSSLSSDGSQASPLSTGRIQDMSSPQVTQGIACPVFGSPHTVSNIDEITLKELEFPEIQVPEKDLPTFDGKELDVILEEPVERHDWMEILSPIKLQTMIEEEQIMQVDQIGLMSPKEKTPHTRPGTDLPLPREVTLSPGVTPIQDVHQLRHRRVRPSLNLELTPLPPSPARRRRRRHLLIDRVMQISKSDIKRNMSNTDDICRPLVLPDTRNSSAGELLARPGRSALKHKPILDMWKRNTVYGICETASDLEVPVWTVPEINDISSAEEGMPQPRKRRRLTLSPLHDIVTDMPQPTIEIGEVEMPSIEVARDVSLSMERSRRRDDDLVSLQASIVSDGDRSGRDSLPKDDSISKSRTSSARKRTRGGGSSESDQEIPAPPPLDINVQAADLYQIPEEEKEISLGPITLDLSMEGLRKTFVDHKQLLRTIGSLTSDTEMTLFTDICPVDTTSRALAAKTFSNLLDLCAAKKLTVEQYRPYDDIIIYRGDEW